MFTLCFWGLEDLDLHTAAIKKLTTEYSVVATHAPYLMNSVQDPASPLLGTVKVRALFNSGYHST